MYNILSGMLKLQAESLKGTDHQRATPVIHRLDEQQQKIEPPNSSNNHNWVLSSDSRTSQSLSWIQIEQVCYIGQLKICKIYCIMLRSKQYVLPIVCQLYVKMHV